MDPEETGAIGEAEQYPPQAPMPQPEETPAIPVEDDATGVDAAQQQQAAGPSRWGPGGEGPRSGLADAISSGAKSIMAMLQGASAADPRTIEQAGRQVDPEGKLPPWERNLQAVSHVRDTEGDQAAWSLLQAHRVSYDAKTSFAKAALQGSAQKPPDVDGAIDAANKAQHDVLDGSSVFFSKHRGGVTATVSDPGGKSQNIHLSPQQFAQFLDTGGDGQWDKVMAQSAPAALQRIAASGAGPGNVLQPAPRQLRKPQPTPEEGSWNRGTQPTTAEREGPPAPQQEGAPAPRQNGPDQPRRMAQAPLSEAVRTGKPVEYSLDAFDRGGASGKGAGNQPAIPGTHDERGHYIGPQEVDESLYSPQAEARSRKMFPSVGEERERQAWLAAHEQQDTRNKIDTQKASHDWTVEAARLRKEGVVDAATIRAEAQARTDQARLLQHAEKMMANRQDQKMREDGRNLRNEIDNRNFLVQTDQQRKEIARKWGVELPRAPSGEAQAPPSGEPRVSNARSGLDRPTAETEPSSMVGMTNDPKQQPPKQSGGPKKMFNGKLYTREEYEALR